MRKFITILFTALATMFAVSCTSCDNDAKFGIEYALTVDGKTDGDVNVDFVNGHFYIDAAANFNFDWTNVQNVPTFEGARVYNLEEALASNDVRVAKAAANVNEWLNSEIGVSEFTGHYDILLKGYVKETLTGLKFEIDRRFTNWPEPNTVE